jgi:putative transposase
MPRTNSLLSGSSAYVKPIRQFNVIVPKGIFFDNDYSRETLGIEGNFSLSSECAIRSLDRIIAWRGKPNIIRAYNGPELVIGRLMEWAAKHQIHTQHIQPGKPQQNSYMEPFNRTVQYGWLYQHYWESINEAQEFASQ